MLYHIAQIDDLGGAGSAVEDESLKAWETCTGFTNQSYKEGLRDRNWPRVDINNQGVKVLHPSCHLFEHHVFMWCYGAVDLNTEGATHAA